MSTTPPPPPSGGYPPYDPKTQWRIYREQQMAAWRAQRDAWRAQRHAWRWNYAGFYGPRVPSVVGPLILIAIGVVWLLIYTGKIAGAEFWRWYGHWWPMLLILAGLALLGEWVLDTRRAMPVRRSGGFVGLLVILAFIGVAAAGVNHFGQNFGPWNWDGDSGDFFNVFGLPEHDVDQAAITQVVPANAAVDIENPRGDVNVTVSPGSSVDVQAHEVAFADSDSGAQKIFSSEKAAVKVSGSAVVVESSSSDHGRVNLAVTVPAGAHVTVNAQHGDVGADGLTAGINVTAPHGDVRLNTITGAVLAHFGKGDLSAHNVQGDVTGDGSCGDVTFSDVTGGVTLSCDYFNDMQFEHIAGPVHFRTARTDVQIAALPGSLSLNDDAMDVTQAKGPVRVVTHSRDVDLSEIYGDSYVDNSNGTIAIAPAGPYGVEARNSKGDVEITLPPNASATVQGRSHNGDIVTDYPLSITGDEDKTVTGRIGDGAVRITVTAENGDVRIKKGSAVAELPAEPALPATPARPAAPNARHLKSTEALPAQPVTQ